MYKMVTVRSFIDRMTEEPEVDLTAIAFEVNDAGDAIELANDDADE